MQTADKSVYAEVAVPGGSSDDYGYFALKKAISDAYKGGKTLVFWYDEQEDRLPADAKADCKAVVDSDWV